MATIVTNKAELEKALKAKRFPIKVRGEYATQFLKQYNKKRKLQRLQL